MDFYIANMVQTQTENYEEDHVLRWMSPLLVELLIHDHQKWAVEQALLLQPKGSPSYERDPFIVNLLFQIESWLLIPPFLQHISR